MESLIVSKVNETFLHIECEPSVERELSEHFCFFVPGYKFMPAYRNRMWDGKIRLFDQRKKTLYVGLYKYLKEFAAGRGYEVLNNDSPEYGCIEPEKLPLEFEQMPILTANQNPIAPRDYQFSALEHALKNEKSLLLSPTASGKSLVIYLAARWYIEQHSSLKILIVVPTVSLVEQMYSDFEDYSSTDEHFHADEYCMRIHGGTVKGERIGRVVISTWQSIYKRPAEFFQNFGMVIGDEAHQFKAKSLTSIMEKCTEAKYRIGTTGTLDGTQTHQLVLEGLFGPVYKVTTSKELMDRGALSQLDISVLVLKYHNDLCKAHIKNSYAQELDFIVGYDARNQFISNLARDQKGNTLVLFNYVEKHGKPLHRLLEKKLDKDRKLFYVSGETDVDTRESVREITETQTNAVIVASIGTFSTGINIRNLHNIIFASPSKSQIRVLQSIGRGLRKSDDGRMTKLYDIADDLHWKNRKNYTLQHAAERIKIYSKEKFKYKLYDINI
tara:strand:+ start:2436 stop:3932 length:1497 start_codon:yes stop_codon:yes gene_type:complete